MSELGPDLEFDEEALYEAGAEFFDAPTPELSPEDDAFVEQIIDKLMMFANQLGGDPLYPYQEEFARRVFESLIINDGAVLTALWSRQAGKTQAVAYVVATVMVLFPKLAVIFPTWFGQYKRGVMVGTFAPIESQAETLFQRIQLVLDGPDAADILSDPEIGEEVAVAGKVVTLKGSGSFCRMQTANPKAQVESKTYHIIIIDECFPAGTPVLTSEGWKPIDDIVNGDRRDWMVATQGTDGVAWSHVKTGYRTKRNSPLVRVDHEHGSLYATANHPFMVNGEGVPAIHLRPGTPLSLVQRVTEPTRANPETVSEVGGSRVQQLTPRAAQELHGRPRGPREDGGYSATHWASPYYPWGQRDRSDEAPEDAAGRARTTVDRRACDPVWRTRQGGDSDALQGGSGAGEPAGSGGDRRGVARNAGPASSRPAEDLMVGVSRVVSVSVLEPGSAEFDQFSDSADYVYTLEVEHAAHNYVTAGVVVGNCQGADDQMVNKSIMPMLASTNGTAVFTGTPTNKKNVFYEQIQINKRRDVKGGHKSLNHHQHDWKSCARYNPRYKTYVQSTMARVGADSDEFLLSYALKWLLERGMFTTTERLDQLGDRTMQNLVTQHYRSPIVLGVDPAKKQDSTVVTAVWVDWDSPDEFGYYDHRILNWLELHGDRWEDQYARIVDFASNYNVLAVAVDGSGLGDVVAERLGLLLPRAQVIPLSSNTPDQSARWKHMMELMNRGLVSWPAGHGVRKKRTFRRFYQQMEDLEKTYQGKNLMAAAPNTADAHDDYPDSLALALYLTKSVTMPEVEQTTNPFYR